MLTLSAFASLAQLGSGVALALALFMEPIQFRERRYRQRLVSALKVLPTVKSEVHIVRENLIWSKMVALDTAYEDAQEESYVPMLIIKIGAAINFIFLLLATIVPEAEISKSWMITILLLCIIPIIVGYGWVSYIARKRIFSLDKAFE